MLVTSLSFYEGPGGERASMIIKLGGVAAHAYASRRRSFDDAFKVARQAKRNSSHQGFPAHEVYKSGGKGTQIRRKLNSLARARSLFVGMVGGGAWGVDKGVFEAM